MIHPTLDPEPAYLFKHALLEEAAYESLLKHERRRLHRQVAESLEGAYANRLDAVAALLANHYEEAGDEAKAFGYAVRAGDAALRIYATAEASQYFERALALVGRLPDLPPARIKHLYLVRGRTFELTARYAEALRNYDELQALARERDDPALALAALVQCATLYAIPSPMQDLDEAQRLSDEALELARRLEDRQAETRIWRNLMFLNNFRGQSRLAVQYGEESLTIARELGLREDAAFTLNDLSRSYASTGQYERARAATDEARAFWRETGNLTMLADNLSRSNRLALALGEYDLAVAFAEEACRISEDIGNLWGQSFCRMFVVYVYLERGELTKGIETMLECIRLAEASGFMVPQIATRASLGWLYGTLGAVERGLELAQAARTRAEEHMPVFRAWPLASLARLHVLAGKLAEAGQILQEGTAALSEDWAQPAQVEMRLAEAELGLAQGDNVRANEVMDDLLQRLRSFGVRTSLSDALYLKGAACWKMGRLEGAIQVLSEARAEAEGVGSRRMLWQILAAASEIEIERGRAAEGERLRRQARENVEYLAEHIADGELRASFMQLPAVRVVMS